MTGLTMLEASRFESLGDNCEFGFVIRKLGQEVNSLFRWARTHPWETLELLRHDFDEMYEYDRLTPVTRDMVLDSRYGIGWHTKMFSSHHNGPLTFDLPEEERRLVFEDEVYKMAYLRRKFAARAQVGGTIYVVKGNAGIPPEVLNGLESEIARIGEGGVNWLLECRATDDPALLGTVSFTSDTRLVGYVREFAPYNSAASADYESWESIVRQCLVIAPIDDWEDRLVRIAELTRAGRNELTLPPKVELRPSQDETTPFTLGTVTLDSSHIWTRNIDPQFRIHAGRAPEAPASIRWDITAPIAGDQLLEFSAAIASPQSDPVLIDAIAYDDHRIAAARTFEVTSARPLLAKLPLPRLTRLDRVELKVRAREIDAATDSGLAVVDISPPELVG